LIRCLYLDNLYCMFMFAFLKFSLFYFSCIFLICRASAEEAIQRMHGTMIGQQIVRLSWGRSPASKQVCIMLCVADFCFSTLLNINLIHQILMLFSVCLLFIGSSSYGRDSYFLVHNKD